MLFAFDLFGTFAFAVSGAFCAVKHKLDIIGVLVVAMATGVGGGIIRDCLLGAHPPAVFGHEAYFCVCMAGGMIVFFAAPKIAPHWFAVLGADAVGLGVFAVIGASKGIGAGLGPVGVALIGMLTAVGGGVVRDLLVNEVPAVLHTGFYASSALLGSIVFYVLHRLEVPVNVAMISAAALTTAARFVSLRSNFNLPRVNSLPASPSQLARMRREQRHQDKN